MGGIFRLDTEQPHLVHIMEICLLCAYRVPLDRAPLHTIAQWPYHTNANFRSQYYYLSIAIHNAERSPSNQPPLTPLTTMAERKVNVTSNYNRSETSTEMPKYTPQDVIGFRRIWRREFINLWPFITLSSFCIQIKVLRILAAGINKLAIDAIPIWYDVRVGQTTHSQTNSIV